MKHELTLCFWQGQVFVLYTACRSLWGPRGLLLFGCCWTVYVGVKRPAREYHGTPPTDAVAKIQGGVFVVLCLKFSICGMHPFEIGPVVYIFSMRHCRSAGMYVLVFRDNWANRCGDLRVTVEV
jgi:hypothetical protein